MSIPLSLDQQRTKCEIYTRVMWYFRPVSHFNTWKKAEHYSRKHFVEPTNANASFINKYMQPTQIESISK